MLALCLDVLPPSINKAYESIQARKGKRVITLRKLSEEGANFKRCVAAKIARLAGDPGMAQVFKELSEETPLELQVVLGFPCLQNAGWPKKAATRYKRVDLSNRIKILEDAVFEALGIDDSRVFQLTVNKIESGKEETTVWISPMMPS